MPKSCKLLVAVPLAILAGMLNADFSRAQEADTVSAEEKAVRAAVESYAAAWNAGDTAALIKLWSPDGDFVDKSGQRLTVTQLMNRRLGEEEKADTNLAIQVDAIKLLTKDTAIADGITMHTHKDSAKSMGGSRFSAVFVNNNGKWLISSVREQETMVGVNGDKLQELDWLVGEWIGVMDKSTVRIQAQWSKGEKFIVRTFDVTEDNGVVLSGTQRIGWDPRSRQIKSWFFDSEGNIGEGFWEQHGDHWIVTVDGVLQDGTDISATNIYTRVDNDSFLRQSFGTESGDQAEPNTEVRVIRVKTPAK